MHCFYYLGYIVWNIGTLGTLFSKYSLERGIYRKGCKTAFQAFQAFQPLLINQPPIQTKIPFITNRRPTPICKIN